MLLRYPDGLTGLALLLLRVSSALIVYPIFMPLCGMHINWWVVATAVLVLGVALVAGLLARPAVALVLVAIAANLYTAKGETLLFLLSAGGSAGALLLLGPGAYSIDAQRFGRRVIRLGLLLPNRGPSR